MTVVKSNDKRRARVEAMRLLLSHFDYPSKDHDLVGRPDPLVVGPAARVHEYDEYPGRFFPTLGAPGPATSGPTPLTELEPAT